MRQKYGIGAHFLSVELLSKKIADLMSDEFGLSFNTKPARLTELGQKLLGLKQWQTERVAELMG